jgi:Protein of unknown function (DUF998)
MRRTAARSTVAVPAQRRDAHSAPGATRRHGPRTAVPAQERGAASRTPAADQDRPARPALPDRCTREQRSDEPRTREKGTREQGSRVPGTRVPDTPDPIAGHDPGSPRPAALGSLLLVAVAVVCVGYLHLAAGVSPVSGMVSDYAFTGVGAVLLPAGELALAAALLLVGRGLAVAGLACRWVRALLVTAGLGLVLVAGVPADVAGVRASLPGVVHKLGGGLLFAALPLVGLILAGRFAARPPWRVAAAPVRVLTVVSAALYGFFLFTYLPGFGVPLPDGALLTGIQGLAERGVLLPEVALIVTVAGGLAVLSPTAGARVARAAGAGRAVVPAREEV